MFCAKVPLVSGAAIRMEGQITVLLIRTANRAIAALAVCLARTLNLRRSRRDGTIDRRNWFVAAMEAIKLLAGYGKPASGKIVCTMR